LGRPDYSSTTVRDSATPEAGSWPAAYRTGIS